jgi:hypothetical protein
MPRLRFRKHVFEQEGYLVALLDRDNRLVIDNCADWIDELDEHNDWRINEKGTIVAPKLLAGFGLLNHSGHLAESELYGKDKYSLAEIIRFFRQL